MHPDTIPPITAHIPHTGTGVPAAERDQLVHYPGEPGRAASRPERTPREPAAFDAESGKALARDYFASVGAFGFHKSQIAILASLVTEDPLLLIGRSGTGKTYLLNSISEALGLRTGTTMRA